MRRLEEMLKPQGLLVLSTLPMGTSVRDDRKEIELGYFYSENNETRGRLDGDEYGTAFVTKDFVTKVVSENLTADLVKHSPRALNGLQDIYVVRAPRHWEHPRRPNAELPVKLRQAQGT